MLTAVNSKVDRCQIGTQPRLMLKLTAVNITRFRGCSQLCIDCSIDCRFKQLKILGATK